MQVEVLHIDECPNWVAVGSRLRDALDAAGLTNVKVEYHLLSTPDDAAQVPFAGSPTILIDGEDAFPGGERTTELACRMYHTGISFAGLPSADQIAAAVRRYATK